MTARWTRAQANDFLLSLSLPPALSYGKLLGQLAKYLALPYPSSTLLEKTFAWARAAGPSQPLTTGLWYLRTFLHAKSNQVSLALIEGARRNRKSGSTTSCARMAHPTARLRQS